MPEDKTKHAERQVPNKEGDRADQEPSIAMGLEMDELDEKATPAEVRQGDSTPVTKLYLDRTPRD